MTKQELKPVPETLTHGRLVYLADRACGRYEHRVTRHKGENGYLAFLTYLQRVFMPATDRLLFELHGLSPPPADSVDYRLMLATLNNEDLVTHHFFQAADELQIERVKALSRRIKRLGKRLDTRASKVGLKTCAKG
jgi:hypothetical protein